MYYCIPPIHEENYNFLWDLGAPEVQTKQSYRGNSCWDFNEQRSEQYRIYGGYQSM